MTNEDLIEIGFERIPHFTIGDTIVYDLGRRRQLSATGIGTPNEFLFISVIDAENPKRITDSICLHNYDYDGYLTIEKVVSLIASIGSSEAIYKHMRL